MLFFLFVDLTWLSLWPFSCFIDLASIKSKSSPLTFRTKWKDDEEVTVDTCWWEIQAEVVGLQICVHKPFICELKKMPFLLSHMATSDDSQNVTHQVFSLVCYIWSIANLSGLKWTTATEATGCMKITVSVLDVYQSTLALQVQNRITAD